MNRRRLLDWEIRVSSAPVEDRMGIVHDFAETLDGDEAKVATSILRMIAMTNDSQNKNTERKEIADRHIFNLGRIWMFLLLICLIGGLFLSFYDKVAATEILIGDNQIKTSSIGIVLVFIAIIGGGYVIISAIKNLRQD